MHRILRVHNLSWNIVNVLTLSVPQKPQILQSFAIL